MKKSQMPLLNGKIEAQKITKTLNQQITKSPNKPCLAVVLVGNNSASELYVNLKEKKALEIGVNFKKFLLPAVVNEKKIIDLIQQLNQNKKITGLLIQLPLPKKFNTNKIIAAIAPEKDVDGLLLQKHVKIISPTIQSIIHLIKKSQQKLAGKNAIILCNSPEFATPLKKQLEKMKIKVDIKFRNQLKHNLSLIALYDIIIVALGKKHWLKPNMLKKNAVVIDVGITRQAGKTLGDAHPACFKKSKFISPVPGGVGPLTVVYLFKNLISLAKVKSRTV